MFQIYKWAFQDWHTITVDELRKVVDPQGQNQFCLTPEQFKEITGEDFVVSTPNATTPATSESATTAPAEAATPATPAQ